MAQYGISLLKGNSVVHDRRVRHGYLCTRVLPICFQGTYQQEQECFHVLGMAKPVKYEVENSARTLYSERPVNSASIESQSTKDSRLNQNIWLVCIH